ncbi:hypothetical protein HU750_03310 [Pseudomonas sp. SWRI50]|uniref:hypothetical protein n=1 Tax=Pseudomonas sp. SWRI50 TaxID=2745484 RepID=UPI001645428C|nr:hypothetical protein [Pseudomonas sp. SWRI50]MBC3484688.1 hypothetical protein [Pseudomonas sp. SWRI50]
MREWICAGALLILAGCGAGDSDTKNSFEVNGTIDEWILADYPDNSIVIGSDKSDPTYGKLKDEIPRVNKEKNEAAHLVARKCKHVVNVLFLRRESSLEELKFIVDCESGERYELTSSDLVKGGAVKSNSDKSIGRADAIQKCKDLVNGKILNKRSLDFHELSDSNYYKAPNGNVRLVLGFDEQGLGGAKTNWRAACTFDADWKGDVTINPN